MIHPYGKIYHWNDLRLKGLLDGIVVIEEKIDGWQVNFGMVEDFYGEPQLALRTKNRSHEGPDIWEPLRPLWGRLQSLDLRPGWTYRGEYVPEKKMNQITYDRPASGMVVIWDIDRGVEEYLSCYDKKQEALRLGFDAVEPLAIGVFRPDSLPGLVPKHSLLGGETEGVVIKNYGRAFKGHLMKGKYVRPEFRDGGLPSV